MIKIENLKFGYRKHPLFDGLNLQLKAGSIYGLLGKNGVGKTSLLKLISGLLRPDGGSLSVIGFTPFERRVEFLEKIFFLPEEFDMPRMTSRTFADTYGVFYKNFSTTDFERYCGEFNVNLDANMHKLSFGEKKKSYISFALACNTQILIMDEPTNGLDIPSKASFRRLLSAVGAEDKLIIVSTHQVRDLSQLIDRVLILDDSDIIINSSVDDILKKISFKGVTPADNPIYSEQSIQGLNGIVENRTDEETYFDMELFFNAVVTEKEKIKTIFGHEK